MAKFYLIFGNNPSHIFLFDKKKIRFNFPKKMSSIEYVISGASFLTYFINIQKNAVDLENLSCYLHIFFALKTVTLIYIFLLTFRSTESNSVLFPKPVELDWSVFPPLDNSPPWFAGDKAWPSTEADHLQA